MPRRKLQKIQELHTLPNVAEIFDPKLKKKLAAFLKDKKPLNLELGCGKGEYTLAMARSLPEENFIGVDIQGERLWHGAKMAIAEKLANVFFLRLPVENLPQLLKPATVYNIWLTFPDPQNKKGDHRKRLTSPRFLNIYKNLLLPGGQINLKTDEKKFFDYSLDNLRNSGAKIIQNKKIDPSIETDPLLNISTFYEKLHRQNRKDIYYLQAIFL